MCGDGTSLHLGVVPEGATHALMAVDGALRLHQAIHDERVGEVAARQIDEALLSCTHAVENGDGVVSASDITNLYNIILGFDYKNIHRSDINVDGATSGSDVTKIYNMILGL